MDLELLSDARGACDHTSHAANRVKDYREEDDYDGNDGNDLRERETHEYVKCTQEERESSGQRERKRNSRSD